MEVGPSIELVDFSGDDKAALLAMINAEDSFTHIGQGRPWTDDSAAKFLHYCGQEVHQSPLERNNFYWAVKQGLTLVGMVGLHTIKYDRSAPKFPKKYFATFLIEKSCRGKGFGVLALMLAFQKFSSLLPNEKYVYADIHDGNERSAKALVKAGFTWLQDKSQPDQRARIQVGSKRLLRMHRPLGAQRSGAPDIQPEPGATSVSAHTAQDCAVPFTHAPQDSAPAQDTHAAMRQGAASGEQVLCDGATKPATETDTISLSVRVQGGDHKQGGEQSRKHSLEPAQGQGGQHGDQQGKEQSSKRARPDPT